MNKKITNVPGRLHNVAVDEHGNQEPLTGANEIMDDALGKMQSKINAEQVEKNNQTDAAIEDRYNKSETNAIVSAETARATTAEENLRQLYNSLSQSQPIPVTSLPETGVAGKIYRLAGESSYADYMWKGTQFIKMAEYDNAIDDEPTDGSNNIVKSGGVNSFVKGVSVRKDVVIYDTDKAEQFNARTNINAKSIDGNINPYVLNRISPDYQKINTDIVNNQWVSKNGVAVVYFHMTQNQTVLLKVRNSTSENIFDLRGWWLTSKPVYEVTDFTNKSVFSIPEDRQDANYKYIEYTALEEGYLVVRHIPNTGVNFLVYRYEDMSSVLNYNRETISNIPIISRKGIDVDSDSATYGEMITMTGASDYYGCSDFIDIQDYVFLQLRVTQAGNSVVDSALFGSLYYDENKNPIKVDSIYQRVGTASNGYRFSTVPTGAKYIRFTVYSSTKSADTLNYVTTIYGYRTTKVSYNRSEHAKVESLEAIYQGNVGTKVITMIPQSYEIYNSYINVFNPGKYINNSVSRLSYIPEVYTIGNTSLKIHYTGADNRALRVCQYGLIPLGSDITKFTVNDFIKYDSFPGNSSESYTGEAIVTLDKNCKRLLIYVAADTGTTRIYPHEILNFITDIEVEQQDGFVKEIIKNDNVEEYVRQALYVNTPTDVNIKPLTLVHITDIHEDDLSVKDVLKFHSLGLSDEILCTGDMPRMIPDDTTIHSEGVIEWLKGSGIMNNALFTLGNHDGATYGGTEYDPMPPTSYAYDGKGKEWIFDNYFADYINEVGYIMPNGYNESSSPYYKSCFWHKDYAEKKIRLIGIDCIHIFDGILNPETGAIVEQGMRKLTNEQELWLISKLNETLDPNNTSYGYSVVVACHYPLDDFSKDNEEWEDTSHKFIFNHRTDGGRVMSYKNNAPVNFHIETTTSLTLDKTMCMRNRVGGPYPSFSKGEVNNIAAIITSWLSRGGKFVSWICGHSHRDMMYYSNNYPDILVIACDQAGINRPSSQGIRDHAYNTGTIFNIVTIDTQNHLIKLIRNGNNMNKYLNSHVYMCYDYINRKVMNEG